MKSKQLGIVAAALAVLAGTWFALEMKKPTPWEGGAFEVPVIEDVLAIEVTRNGETWRVEREGSSDDWVLTQPWRFPANGAYVEVMTSLFDAIDPPVRDLVRPAQEAGSALGFAEGSGAGSPIRVTIHGRERSSTLRIGNTVGVEATSRTLTWISPEGDGSLYRVGADLRTPFNRSAAEMRDRNLTSFDEERVRAVILDGPDGRLTLRREGESWSIEGAGETIDAELVDRAVRGLANIRASEIADQVSVDAAGLASPEFRATIETDTASTTLLLGMRLPEIEGSAPRAYAAVEGLDAVFVISEASANRIATRLGDLIDRTALSVDRDTISAITIVEGGVSTEFVATPRDCAAEGSGCDPSELLWSVGGARIDSSAFDALLARVVSLEADRWALEIDPATAGLETPTRTIRVSLRVGVTHTIELGGALPASAGATGERVWVRVDGGRIFELNETARNVLVAPMDALVSLASTP